MKILLLAIFMIVILSVSNSIRIEKIRRGKSGHLNTRHKAFHRHGWSIETPIKNIGNGKSSIMTTKYYGETATADVNRATYINAIPDAEINSNSASTNPNSIPNVDGNKNMNSNTNSNTNTNSSVVNINGQLYTPLTTGTYSSGGQISQTKPGSLIPYGTGYSYGPWQKIPNELIN